MNAIDRILDWNPELPFVETYLDALRSTVAGEKPIEAFAEYVWTKKGVLESLCSKLDGKLSDEEVLLLAGGLYTDRDSDPHVQTQEMERLLTDNESRKELGSQRAGVLDVYRESCDRIPHEILSGQVAKEAADEDWVSAS